MPAIEVPLTTSVADAIGLPVAFTPISVRPTNVSAGTSATVTPVSFPSASSALRMRASAGSPFRIPY